MVKIVLNVRLLLAFIMCVSGNVVLKAQMQQFSWAKSISSAYATEYGFAVASDKSGNVYAAGIYSGTVDFDPGPGLYELREGAAFVMKMDPAGHLLWAKSFGKDEVVIQDVAVDENGSVYTTGYFMGVTDGVDFDPGADTFVLRNAFMDVFVSKLDSNGDFSWAIQFNGDDGVDVFNQGYSLWVQEPGAVYVTGAFGGAVDFDPGPGTRLISTPDFNANAFVCKLHAADGGLNWVKTIAGIQRSVGSNVVADASGNIYVSGTFVGTHDFDPADAVSYDLTTAGNRNVYLLKLDTAGDFRWARQFGGVTNASSNRSEGWGLVHGKNALYLTGQFQGTIDFNPAAGDTVAFTATSGKWDCFLTGVDTAGAFLWAKQIGGDDNNTGMSVSADAYGNVYLAGRFLGTTHFSTAPAFQVTSSYGSSVFLSRYRADGSFVWAGEAGHHQNRGAGHGSYGTLDICADRSGNIYTTGSYSTASDFDPGTGTEMLTPVSGPSVFIVKLSCNDTGSLVLRQTACTAYELNGEVFSTSGTYRQVIPNEAGCDSVITLHLTVDPLNFDVTVDNGMLRSADASADYQWIDCRDNSIIPGATAQTYEPPTSGRFSVVVSKHGCSDTSDCYNVFASGIADNGYQEQIVVYPNPVSQKCVLRSTQPLEGSLFVKNMIGQTVQRIDNLNGTLMELDLRGLTPGVYFLDIASENQPARIRILKN